MFTTGLFRYLRRTDVKEGQLGGYLATTEHQIGEELRALERRNLKKRNGYGKIHKLSTEVDYEVLLLTSAAIF